MMPADVEVVVFQLPGHCGRSVGGCHQECVCSVYTVEDLDQPLWWLPSEEHSRIMFFLAQYFRIPQLNR